MSRSPLLLLPLLFACRAQPAAPAHVAPGSPVAPLTPVVSPLVELEGTSVEGRPLEARVLGTEGPVVLFVASLHGDETAGTGLLETMALRLVQDPSLLAGSRAVLVARANPDGIARGTRRNARGVDLNRNFPAENFTPSRYNGRTGLSEPESRYLYRLVLALEPTRIVSLHQAAECLDFDGPAFGVVHRMADRGPLPIRRLGDKPGSLGSWAGTDGGLPVVTVELPRDADDLTPDEAWDAYGPLLLEALR